MKRLKRNKDTGRTKQVDEKVWGGKLTNIEDLLNGIDL